MATTSYLCRAIRKAHVDNQSDFAGTYSLLVRAKSMPSPVTAPNTVEKTDLEDDCQTFLMGIKTSDAQEITGNLEKSYLQGINALGNAEQDVMYLYGSDGVGNVAKYVRTAQVSATPSDVGGVDEVVEMTVTIVPTTVAEEVTDLYTVVDNGDGTFTVTKNGI